MLVAIGRGLKCVMNTIIEDLCRHLSWVHTRVDLKSARGDSPICLLFHRHIEVLMSAFTESEAEVYALSSAIGHRYSIAGAEIKY